MLLKTIYTFTYSPKMMIINKWTIATITYSFFGHFRRGYIIGKNSQHPHTTIP